MKHIVSIDDLSASEIEKLVFESIALEKAFTKKKNHKIPLKNKSGVALVFKEPSTRTRVSFERACQLLGKKYILLESKGSSFEKGETLEDALLVLHSYDLDTFVMRTEDEHELEPLKKYPGISIVSGGEGSKEHPTQALFDLAALAQAQGAKKMKDLKGLQLAIVGDLKHSRVTGSWAKLAKKVGIELTGVAPKSWQRAGIEKNFDRWPEKNSFDAVMALRIQKERFTGGEDAGNLKDFQITQARLGNRWLMHPGPVNWGVELSPECLNYSKSLILKQTRLGMFLRAVVLNSLKS